MRYTREDACRAWLAYADIGPQHLRAMIRKYGSAEAVYDGFMSKERGLDEDLTARQRGLLAERCGKSDMHAMLICMRKHEMGVLTEDDWAYPDALRNLDDPPVTLFYQGDPQAVGQKCLTVVGTRAATPQSVAATRSVAKELSASGVCIVSGMAVGIDAAAHQGSLEGGTPGAAVLACGLDVDYPSDNRELKERLLKAGGCIFSEYPPHTPAIGWRFPPRNRILSGLSRGVLMMEARIRSGAITTVQHALDQGRDVFVYPGRPDSDSSEGARMLLRDGARFFVTAADVLEDMGWDQAPAQKKEENASLPPLTEQQRRIMSLLNTGELSMDQLSEQSGLSAPELATALTMLQLMGKVRALPGKCFSLI